ncbi:MAG: hypothetical protein Q7R97_01135 [Candidatus Daviesbacteria bacterium]|nr:hypothetical protein [Candidatus Daviesbacteria bacterium]
MTNFVKKILSSNKNSDYETKGFDIVHDAMKKSQAMLGNAELEGIKTVADVRVQTNKMEAKYEAQITLMAVKAETEFTKLLKDLAVRAEQSQLLLEDAVKEKTQEIMERFEKNLANFLSSSEYQGITAINTEITQVRLAIEEYKKAQIKAVDENIKTIVEETVAKVLAKKLSLDDQMDLIYKSLEEAKKEKWII